MSVWEELARRKERAASENIWMALDTLRNNKLRSALTLLGITVAITTLIAVVALLMGLNRNIEQSIQSYGINTAFFSKLPDGPHFGRLTKEERTRKEITYEEFLAVQAACAACVNATVSVFPHEQVSTIRYQNSEVVGSRDDFRGTTGEFFSVYANAVIKLGRPFTEAENQHRREVAVIGEDTAKGLFGTLSPIDKEVIVNGHAFTVIGVFQKPNGGLGGPDNSDRRVVVPYWTFRKVFPEAQQHGIRIEGASGRLPQAIDQARVALRRARQVAYDQPDNFAFDTADSLISNFHSIVGAVALAITVIASVGLMIGGVGVMNIMLVSVTERTREIGVRLAIGARRRDIVWQFLTEAMTLAAAGGVVGVLIGYLISAAIRALVPTLPTYVPLWSIILSVAIATSVGLFFGMYPAVKAAKLDPVVALRYE